MIIRDTKNSYAYLIALPAYKISGQKVDKRKAYEKFTRETLWSSAAILGFIYLFIYFERGGNKGPIISFAVQNLLTINSEEEKQIHWDKNDF